MNITRIEPGSPAWAGLERALHVSEGHRPISLTMDGGLKIKVGEGMWSAPLATTRRPVHVHAGCPLDCTEGQS